jgi:hypothetical protein
LPREQPPQVIDDTTVIVAFLDVPPAPAAHGVH